LPDTPVIVYEDGLVLREKLKTGKPQNKTIGVVDFWIEHIQTKLLRVRNVPFGGVPLNLAGGDGRQYQSPKSKPKLPNPY